MSSLTSCLKKSGKVIGQGDKQELLALRKDIIADGVASDRANELAVTEYLDTLTSERLDLLMRIEDAGGDTRSIPKPAVFSRAQTPPSKPTNPDGRPPAPASEPVQPIDVSLSQDEKYAVARALAEENKELLDPIFEEIGWRLDIEIQSNIKTKASALEKINRPEVLIHKGRPWFNVEHVRDIFRFRALIDNIEQVEQLLRMLNQELTRKGGPGITILKADTALMTNPTAWGWRAVSFDIQLPNGQIAEFYASPRELISVSEAEGHLLYEKWRARDRSNLSRRELRRFEKDMDRSNELYQRALEDYQGRSGDSDAAILASVNNLEALASSLTTFNSSANSATLSSGTGSSQLPLLSRAATNDPSLMNTRLSSEPSGDASITDESIPLYDMPEQPQPTYLRTPEETQELAVKRAQLTIVLAPAIRALAGKVQVNVLQTADELPVEAAPSDVEGMWLVGTDQVYLVADNLNTVERAKRVLTHEVFGHLAMEELAEFAEILKAVQNLKAMGNSAILEAAAHVLRTQGQLDSTTEAKEIIAVMAERGVQSGLMGRAMFAMRQVLRRLGLSVNYSETELRELIVRAARGLQSEAAAKRAALSVMPVQAQILHDPNAVAHAVHQAINEVYAFATLQDTTTTMAAELVQLSKSEDPAAVARAREIRQALYRQQLAPTAAPDVVDPDALYSVAWHGSPHTFESFSLDHIGSGEGYQAYGWGLYFSSKREIADWYRDKLSGGSGWTVGGMAIADRWEAQKAFAEMIGEPLAKGLPRHEQPDWGWTLPHSMVPLLQRAASEIANRIQERKELGNTDDDVANWIAEQIVYANMDLRHEKEMAERPWPIGTRAPAGAVAVLSDSVRQQETILAVWKEAAKQHTKLQVGAPNAGALYKVDVPEEEEMLDWREPLAGQPESVQRILRENFPEIVGEVSVQDGFYNGKDIYELIARQMPVSEYLQDKTASLRLRELGIPGHIFEGRTSDEKNYVVYDDSRIEVMGRQGPGDPALFSQTGYHGTPHKFDAFSLDFMGTGEGAQAFGWGLYFSSNKGVAEFYRGKLANRNFTFKNGKAVTRLDLEREVAKALRKGAPKPEKEETGAKLAAFLGVPQQVKRAVDRDVQANTVARAVVAMKIRNFGQADVIERELTTQIRIRERNLQDDRDMHAAYLKSGVGAGIPPNLSLVKAREESIARQARELVLWQNALKVIDDIRDAGKAGYVYKVEIPDSEAMLRYDALLTEQHPAVEKILREHFPELWEAQWMNEDGAIVDRKQFGSERIPAAEMIGRDFYDFLIEAVRDKHLEKRPTVAKLFPGFTRLMADYQSDKAASLYLRSLGIPGHEFRGISSKEINYVVYDDSQISIVEVEGEQPALFSRLGRPDVMPKLPGTGILGEDGQTDSELYVFDTFTGMEAGGPYQTRANARRGADRLDNKYGAIRYAVRRVPKSQVPALFSKGIPAGGRGRMIETLREWGIPEPAAVVDYYIEQKFATYDSLGQFRVKHGAFLDKEVLMRAAEMVGAVPGVAGRARVVDTDKEGQVERQRYTVEKMREAVEERREQGAATKTAEKDLAVEERKLEQMQNQLKLFSRAGDRSKWRGVGRIGAFHIYQRGSNDYVVTQGSDGPIVGSRLEGGRHLQQAEAWAAARQQHESGDMFGGQAEETDAERRQRELQEEIERRDAKRSVGEDQGDAGPQGDLFSRQKSLFSRSGHDNSQPWIGVLTADGQHEFRNAEEGKAADWHHTYALKELLDEWGKDSTLRFVREVKYPETEHEEEVIILTGEAVLDPLGAGRAQIAELATRLKAEGTPGNIDMRAEHMGMGTAFEGRSIGTIDKWAAQRRNKKPAPRPMFSRAISADPEIERLIATKMATPLEDITPKDRLRSTVQTVKGLNWLSVKQGIIDSAASIEALEVGLYGELLDASESAYKSVLSTRNLGSVMAAVMHKGIPVYQNGVFRPRSDREGLLEIVQPLAQHEAGNLLPQWELYIAAFRAQRLIKEHNPDGTLKEKLFTQAEIDKALSLAITYPEFEVARQRWQKFNSQLLDLAIKTGVINGEEAKIWRKNDYVPFYRAMEDVEYEGGQGTLSGGKGVADVRSGIRRLHGEDKPLGNIFENMVMNTSYLIDAVFRNTAMQRVVAMAEGIAMEKVPLAWQAERFSADRIASALIQAGLLQGPLSTATEEVLGWTEGQREEWVKIFKRVKPQGDNIVSVLQDGKPVYYRVEDPLLLRSIAAMGAQQFGGVMNLFRVAKRTLTAAVTIDPAFMMANFIRDTLSTWVVANNGTAPPFLQALKGAKSAWQQDEDSIALMMAGAGGGGFYDHNPQQVREMLAKKMPKGEVNAFANSILTPRGLWRFWQKIGNASEQANRVAKFRQVVRDGGSVAEAAYQARDVLNFTMAGDYEAMKFLVQTVPFLNARVQGLYRLYRGGKEHPTALAMKGLTIMAATMALLLRNMDNDEYEELPEWDKDTYWHFWVEGEHFRLPKPFEIGAMFATIPERSVRLMRGDEDLKLFTERMWRMVMDTFAFNPVPQLLKPAVEQYANRNMFTGSPIVGLMHEGTLPEGQYDPWTSETMRGLAETMPDFAGEWLRSPVRLEAAVRGYFGAVGMYALGVSDAIVRRGMGHPDRPAKAIQDYPVITRFWRNPVARTSKYSEELYDMLNEADAIYRTLNTYRSQGRIEEYTELMQGSQSKLSARKYLQTVATQIRRLNKQARDIQYSPLLSPAQKRSAMDDINTQKRQVLQQVASIADIY